MYLFFYDLDVSSIILLLPTISWKHMIAPDDSCAIKHSTLHCCPPSIDRFVITMVLFLGDRQCGGRGEGVDLGWGTLGGFISSPFWIELGGNIVICNVGR